MRMVKYPVGVLALALGVAPALGQEAADEKGRMERFERRLDEMEQRHREELRARDAEIARLREMVEKMQGGSAARPERAPESEAEARQRGDAAATAPSAGPSEAARRAVLEDIESRQAKQSVERILANFNPDIAVIADFIASVSSDRSNDARNRLDVREVELDLRAAVHPRADGVLILAFERDAHNPVFAEAHGDEDGEEHEEGIESNVGIEEAYLLIHDTGVKNLTAKIGRFHVRFGRQNMLHLHDLPTVDPPLVNQAFLAPEALTDAGVSLSYVVPNPWNQYIEVIGEILSGEGASSESPTLSGDIDVDSPAFNTHILWNTDLAENINLELGASWLTAHASGNNRLDVNLFGIDATLIRRDPRGRFNNQMLQAELMYGVVDDEEGGRNHPLGAYVLFQQQLNRDWYAGIRADWTENPHDDLEEAYALSPYLSWYWTEFLRFRVQYQFLDGDGRDEEHALFMQATWIFGAHPPHPYWTMR